MKESAWLKFGEASAHFWSARLGVMPRESFMRKREKGLQTGRRLSAAFVVPRRQPDFGGRTRIRLREFARQSKRLFIFRGRIRGGVICRDDQILVAHVGVVRGKEHAGISSDAGDNRRLERGRKKAGVLRFEDKKSSSSGWSNLTISWPRDSPRRQCCTCRQSRTASARNYHLHSFLRASTKETGRRRRPFAVGFC